MSNANFQVVTSSKQFTDALESDLNRISLISFWAQWAEPCKDILKVVAEIAEKYPDLLVLQVEAEEQEDIAESFEVQSVPTNVILRGHTLLDRIVGGDAQRLTESVAKHLGKVQQPPPVVQEAEKKVESEKELETRMRGIMNGSPVVLFMKGKPDEPRCGFSRKAVQLLRDQNVEFSHFDILEDEAVRQGLKKLNEWPTFPQFIVKGDFVGGLDVVKEMVDSGEFAEIFATA